MVNAVACSGVRAALQVGDGCQRRVHAVIAGEACIMRVVVLSKSWKTRELRIAKILHIRGPAPKAKVICKR